MRHVLSSLLSVVITLSGTVGLANQTSGDAIRHLAPAIAPPGQSPRSFFTGKYRNLFHEIGKSDSEVSEKLNKAWKQLFYGDDASQRVYFPVGTDMAYIKDVGNDDVRSEGMSYGMMIAAQLDRRPEFDRLWRWAKTNMQDKEGPWKGSFAWSCEDSGKQRTKLPAPDGEEYFVMALFFADARWGSGKGILNYRAEANSILHGMLHREQDNGGIVDDAHDMFNRSRKQVVFDSTGAAATFTDPSYQLPAFYELWARRADSDKKFWSEAAGASRAFFRQATNPITGLTSDYTSFDGAPMKAPWNAKNSSDNFQFDAFRVIANISTDYAWFGTDPWERVEANRLLDFFAAQKPTYVSNYTVDGKPLVDFLSTGLIAMNAVGALASNSKVAPHFVQALWDAPIPSGKWRYYDGMLYILGLLQASGQYRIWSPR